MTTSGSFTTPGSPTRRPPLHEMIRTRVPGHLDPLRHDLSRLFAGLIDPALAAEALAQEGIRWRECVYTPMVTL